MEQDVKRGVKISKCMVAIKKRHLYVLEAISLLLWSESWKMNKIRMESTGAR